MYNRAVLMGRICNDLTLKQTPNGTAVLQFRLAVERSYAAKGEERQTDFFNIVAWRGTAEFIAKYFSKGRMILVDGELQTRQYEDKNGSTQTVVELIVANASFTGEPKGGASSPAQYTSSAPAPGAPEQSAEAAGTVETDDDYPF